MAGVASLEAISASRYIGYGKTGNIMRLPSDNLELAAAKGKYFMHRGLHLVESSIQIGRAMNEAIIFTFGLSGAGKSTTLNHLFGIQLAKVSEEEACTNDVSYFVATMPSVDCELENLKIGFVDLPGWADGRGINFQAQNMAAIEHFIAEHPHLGSRARRCFPNIVMIVVSASDNRAKGEASPAVLMMKAVKHLHIIDRKRHNVVIVMTHALSIPSNDIQKKKELYQGHCRTIFGFEPPFVYVENSYGVKGHNLQIDKDWTILNDEFQTRQPYNVFKALIDQMNKNCDEVGREAVRIFFSSRNTFKPSETGRVERSQVNKKNVQKWLKRVVHNPTECRDSVVSQIIAHHIESWTKSQKQMLEPMLCELYLCGICTVADLENLTIAEVQIKLPSYMLQDFDMKLLINLFKVKPLDFPLLHQHLPSTYRIQNESFEPIKDNIFEELPNSHHTSQGLQLPEFLKAHKYFQSEKRIIDFSHQILPLPSEESEVEDTARTFKITFNIKEIMYKIYFDLNTSINDFKLTEEFMHSIEKLPIGENLDMAECEDFFGRYGHLILTGSTCGGSIEGTVQFTVLESQFNLIEYKYIMQECIQTIIANEGGDMEHLKGAIPPNYTTLINTFQHTAIKFNGGEAPLFCDCVEHLNAAKYNMWVKSLNNNLVIVDKFDADNIQPLAELVCLLNPEKGNALKNTLVGLEEGVKVRTGSFLTPLCSLFTQTVDLRDRAFSRRSFLNTITPGENYNINQPPFPQQIPVTNYSMDPNETLTNQVPPATPPVPEESVPNTECIAFQRAFIGFPGSSIVQIATGDREKKLEDIHLRDLKTLIDSAIKPVDALCYFLDRDRRKLSKISFDPTPDTSMLFMFVVISFQEGKIKLGHYQRILRRRMLNSRMKESFVKAIELQIRDYIYIYNEQTKKLQTTQIIDISSDLELGCYNPISNDYNLIVDKAVIPDQCFPGNATVTLRGGEKVRMDEVKIGDHVLSIHPRTGKPVYSKVYLWAHRDPHITATFLHITHPHGHLHISANHLILSGEQRRPVPAGHLTVGDTIHSFLSPTATATATAISVPVLHIHTCTQVGFYAPFTNNGLIVVDGIASSVYSQLSPPRSRSHAHVCAGVTGVLVGQLGMHRVGECVMAPVRVACKLSVGSLVLNKQMDATTHIHKYCQCLMKICGYA